MKKITTTFLLSSSLILSACSDGIPSVSDAHHPVVDGTAMTSYEFIRKYCISKVENLTCREVHNAMILDAGKGTVPRF